MPDERSAFSPIGALLTPQDVLLDVDAASSDALLERASAHLSVRCRLPRHAILDSLLARERLGSTGLGHGVALPHARMPLLTRAFALVARTRQPIDFDAPDRRPVDVFLVLLIPKDSEHHLTLMACAAQQLGDREFRRELKTSSDPAHIAAMFGTLPATSGAD